MKLITGCSTSLQVNTYEGRKESSPIILKKVLLQGDCLCPKSVYDIHYFNPLAWKILTMSLANLFKWTSLMLCILMTWRCFRQVTRSCIQPYSPRSCVWKTWIWSGTPRNAQLWMWKEVSWMRNLTWSWMIQHCSVQWGENVQISGHSGTSWSRCNHNPWESY